MHKGRDLVKDFNGKTPTIYSLEVARWLWTEEELMNGLIKDSPNEQDEEGVDNRTDKAPLDSQRVALLQGKQYRIMDLI